MTSEPSGPSVPSAIVAVSIVALIGAIGCTAIIHYSSVNDALKIWSSLAGLLGVITGAFVSYFFTRQSSQQAVKTAEVANQTAVAANVATAHATAAAATAKQAVANTLELLPDDTRDKARADPFVARTMSFEFPLPPQD
jgi:hypothetical protein